jgi:hypothetical protein
MHVQVCTINRCFDISVHFVYTLTAGCAGLNLGIYVFVYVYKVHMCVYMLGGGMRSWSNSFFSLTY